MVVVGATVVEWGKASGVMTDEGFAYELEEWWPGDPKRLENRKAAPV